MALLLTAKEVAERVGGPVGVDTVRKAFRDGELAGIQVGRSYGFFEHDVDAWLNARRHEATTSHARIDATPTRRSAARRSRTS